MFVGSDTETRQVNEATARYGIRRVQLMVHRTQMLRVRRHNVRVLSGIVLRPTENINNNDPLRTRRCCSETTAHCGHYKNCSQAPGSGGGIEVVFVFVMSLDITAKWVCLAYQGCSAFFSQKLNAPS